MADGEATLPLDDVQDHVVEGFNCVVALVPTHLPQTEADLALDQLTSPHPVETSVAQVKHKGSSLDHKVLGSNLDITRFKLNLLSHLS